MKSGNSAAAWCPPTPLLDTRIFPCAQTIIRSACVVLALVWHCLYRRLWQLTPDKLLVAYLHVLTFWQDAQVVKAKPVPLSVYNGAAPQVHSSKPLTEPMSPVFRSASVSLSQGRAAH